MTSAAFGWRRAIVVASLCTVLGACAGSPEPGDGEGEVSSAVGATQSSATADAGDRTGATSCWTSAQSSSAPDGSGIEFDDVTESVGLIEPLTGMYGHATAAGDVNADGWTDLFVGGFADRPADDYRQRGADGPSPDRLLLGGPDGFTADTRFPGQRARTSGATFADLDGDGDLDLVAARNPRGDGDIESLPTTLYENTSNGWLERTTVGADIAGRSIAAIDVDRDGQLDLVLAGDRFGPGSTRAFRNEGDFRFRDATDDWGLPDDLETLAIATVDLDGDGWMDIIASGDQRVMLGGPTGFETATLPALEWPVFGDEDDPAGIAVGDLDGDGSPDLVVGQHFNSTLDDGQRVEVRLYLNRSQPGSLDMIDATDAAGMPALTTKSPHVVIADLDNDGYNDIVTSAVSADGEPIVLRHRGDDAPSFDTIGEPGDGEYWVTGASDDFDHDGLIDVFMMSWEPERESTMFRNTSAGGHWIGLTLSSEEGPGTVIDVRASDGDRLLGRAWATSTTGYAAGAPPTVHVGLGDDVDAGVQLVVTAPDGAPSTLDVQVDGHYSTTSC